MSAKAVGAYLATVREARGITTKTVAEAIHSSPTHVWRIEKGVTEGVSAELLHRFIAAIGARLEEVHQILLDEAMPADEGKRLAHELIASEQLPGSDLTDQSSDAEVRQALRDLEQRLRPGQRWQWLRLGLVLLDEPVAAAETPLAPPLTELPEERRE
ncbi:MAG: helix-turn-helix transcriptional regulator [Chloroflexales bacterium]|nr:helix-turn-helix transcriptional regulator [Chloroflexales bacterium]